MDYNPYENNNNQSHRPENNGYEQPAYQQPEYTAQPQYTQPQNYQQQYTEQPTYGQQPMYNQPTYGQPPYNAQQPPYYGQPMYTEKDGSKGMAIASLILGISSFFCCGFIFSILGFIFGLISKSRKPHGNGLAVAGIIVSIVGFVATILVLVFGFASGTYQDLIDEIMYY